jgi:hypothetical protein
MGKDNDGAAEKRLTDVCEAKSAKVLTSQWTTGFNASDNDVACAVAFGNPFSLQSQEAVYLVLVEMAAQETC